jgi:protein phosphatase
MGGHAAGEVASALALKTLVEAVGERRDLGSAFRMANERVHSMASEPGKQGMGTTLVAVLVDGAEYWVANVGDSRAYRLSQEGIRRLTEDHSFVAEAMKRGQSEAEAMATPWKDALTRSIGTEEEVEVDVFGPHSLEDDTAFLICSDGLYKTLGDQELRALFGRSGGARGAAQALVAAAYDAGSDDNISVAIAEYGGVPRDDSATTQVLAYDPVAGAAGVGVEKERDSSMEGPSSSPTSSTASAPVDESAVVGGLPLAALAAILVVGVLVAILIFGG